MIALKKIIAFVVAVISGALLCILLSGLSRMVGISKPSSAFATVAYGASFVFGRWVYTLIRNLLSKHKEKEEIVDSQVLEFKSSSKENSDDLIVNESNQLK